MGEAPGVKDQLAELLRIVQMATTGQVKACLFDVAKGDFNVEAHGVLGLREPRAPHGAGA
jgi:hypothetical protein